MESNDIGNNESVNNSDSQIIEDKEENSNNKIVIENPVGNSLINSSGLIDDDKEEAVVNLLNNPNHLNSNNEAIKLKLAFQDKQPNEITNLDLCNVITNGFLSLSEAIVNMGKSNVMMVNEMQKVTFNNSATVNQVKILNVKNKQINLPTQVSNQTDLNAISGLDNFYTLYVKINNSEDSKKIKQLIRDEKLMDGDNPIEFEAFKTDTVIGEILMKFKNKEDYNKIVDCLNGKFTITNKSNSEIDRSIAERYVIYGFKNDNIQNADDLKAKILRFNKDMNANGQRIFNSNTIQIDENKFSREYGSASVVEFVGNDAVNRIRNNQKLNLDFNPKRLVKYFPIKPCLKCCSTDHHDSNMCSKPQVCFRCARNHDPANCEFKTGKSVRCVRRVQKFGSGSRTNHMANSLVCYARKDDMINLNKQELEK